MLSQLKKIQCPSNILKFQKTHCMLILWYFRIITPSGLFWDTLYILCDISVFWHILAHLLNVFRTLSWPLTYTVQNIKIVDNVKTIGTRDTNTSLMTVCLILRALPDVLWFILRHWNIKFMNHEEKLKNSWKMKYWDDAHHIQ